MITLGRWQGRLEKVAHRTWFYGSFEGSLGVLQLEKGHSRQMSTMCPVKVYFGSLNQFFAAWN